MQVPNPPAPKEKETSRFEAFSDGVFAIAITLLILDLKAPELGEAATNAQLFKALLHQWPNYIGLITSFFTILIMWIHHHALVRNIARTDVLLHFANGLLLLGITFVPYPTGVLTTYFESPAAKAATAFYAGTFVFIAACFYFFVRVAFRPGFLVANASPEFIAKTKRSYNFGPPLYIIATLSASIDPRLCLLICTALWIFWATSITKNTRD